MTTKIEKVLRKLDQKQREIIIWIMKDLAAGKYKKHNPTKLVGYKHRYRIRKWKIRIVYDIDPDTNTPLIIDVAHRSHVYKTL